MENVHLSKGDRMGETRSIKGVLSSWNRDGNASDKEKRWKLVPACIWWTIWKKRNNRSFENTEVTGFKRKEDLEEDVIRNYQLE
ncbi:hypothetical protein H5410_013967 [Solanum commersonii]|uniref:Uncharacterized protein n=1 Tax=Solanum commersonii TaxID=4109 RepID=A0A9J5ZQ25_SOLCO|nr:hypothetical protein H5410_013967 [Solanum commersonii]